MNKEVSVSVLLNYLKGSYSLTGNRLGVTKLQITLQKNSYRCEKHICTYFIHQKETLILDDQNYSN